MKHEYQARLVHKGNFRISASGNKEAVSMGTSCDASVNTLDTDCYTVEATNGESENGELVTGIKAGRVPGNAHPYCTGGLLVCNGLLLKSPKSPNSRGFVCPTKPRVWTESSRP